MGVLCVQATLQMCMCCQPRFSRETLCLSTFYPQNPLNLTLSDTYGEQIRTSRDRVEYVLSTHNKSLIQAVTTTCALEQLSCLLDTPLTRRLFHTRNSACRRSSTPGPQPVVHAVFCLHWLSGFTNCLLSGLPVDLAFYKQQRSIGTVNYPCLVTNNKIITL